jgi:hypothetical protein
LADVFSRTAALHLQLARLEAGWQIDGRGLAGDRERLVQDVDELASARRWSDSGRLLIAGLARRVDGLAAA